MLKWRPIRLTGVHHFGYQKAGGTVRAALVFHVRGGRLRTSACRFSGRELPEPGEKQEGMINFVKAILSSSSEAIGRQRLIRRQT